MPLCLFLSKRAGGGLPCNHASPEMLFTPLPPAARAVRGGGFRAPPERKVMAAGLDHMTPYCPQNL